MDTAYLVVALLAIAANAFSGIAALAHFRPILPGMVRAGVPESWLTWGCPRRRGAAEAPPSPQPRSSSVTWKASSRAWLAFRRGSQAVS